MMFGPDDCSSDEDGFSDDNDYYEFKKRRKNVQNQIKQIEGESEAEKTRKKLQLIFSAISYGKDELLIKELDEGLNVNIDLEFDWTPLLLASTVANARIISELLKRGADINRTRDAFTPLMLACNISTDDEASKGNTLACIELLVENGVDVNAVDRRRRTALMLAAHNGHSEAVKLLLPLCDIEAEDNQRWTALFWAVYGHQTETVDFLVGEGASCDKIDVRGDTVMDIARSNGFEDVLKLLPDDPNGDDRYIHFNSTHLNFEETFTSVKKNEKPDLFNDVCRMLYGSRSESVIPLFADKKIGLSQFLSLSDSKLKDIGVRLPYQRNRILGGLYKFHKHPFQPKSIPFVRRNEIYTNIDISATVLSCIKQLIAMEASLKFIIDNSQDESSPESSKEVEIALEKIHKQINRLKLITKQFVKRTEEWDAILKPADRITKKRWNVPWSGLLLSFSVLSLVGLFFKMK